MQRSPLLPAMVLRERVGVHACPCRSRVDLHHLIAAEIYTVHSNLSQQHSRNAPLARLPLPATAATQHTRARRLM